MKSTLDLPVPTLAEGRFASISLYTDEQLFAQTGIRIGFTTRQGGVSTGPYDSLNLGSHVNDDLACVESNRNLLKTAVGFSTAGLVVPNQVHGDASLFVDSSDISAVQEAASKGIDALILAVPQVMGLLCFADCVPVILVLPTGLVAVVHAGWRGVENGISAKTLQRMIDWEWERYKTVHTSIPAEQFSSKLVQGANVYIGPHIHGECFETSEEIRNHFVKKFGQECALDQRHVILEKALMVQLEQQGVSSQRIVSLNKCTVCNNHEFFSYRGQEGIAGRHGAFAIRTQ